jgi:hypothetical protein
VSTPPPPFDPFDDADEQYRRASEHDPSRPSEATRRAVLEHAERLAAGRARRGWLPLAGVTLRWQAVVGTTAAAALAGVMIAPQFLSPTVPAGSQGTEAAPPAAKEALQESAPAPAPVESVHPVAVAAEPKRVRAAPSAQQVPRRESAPAPAEPAAPTPERSASDIQGGLDSSAARAAPLEEVVVVTGGRRAPPPTAAAAPVAATRPPAAEARGSAGTEVLRQAAAAGDLSALKEALAGGGDIDARDAEGRTPLMQAILHGQSQAVAVLLAHGADPNAADAHGTTPLAAAVAGDQRTIIATLRRYGAR